MNNRNHSLVLSITASIIIAGQTGCAGTLAEDEEDVGTAESALEIDNALTPNALTPNALTPNALTPIKDPGTAGTLSRDFLKYTVGCALSTSQSFSFSWTDSDSVVHNETYVGLLGLATAWTTGPLDLAGQRIVSACLASRTNYYGTTVLFSARSPLEPLNSGLSNGELNSYKEVEGAFWGNIFSSIPYLNTCYDAANVANSRSKMRDCAVGHLVNGVPVECGIINITGACSTVCSGLDGQDKYPSCTDHAEIPGSTATTNHVVSSVLK